MELWIGDYRHSCAFEGRFEGELFRQHAEEINNALAPLLARAEMAEKLAEFIRVERGRAQAVSGYVEDYDEILAAWDSIKKEDSK